MILRCWAFNPAERPFFNEIVLFLDSILFEEEFTNRDEFFPPSSKFVNNHSISQSISSKNSYIPTEVVLFWEGFESETPNFDFFTLVFTYPA